MPSAAKSIRSDYQSKVFVCVSVIRGRILITAWMRSIGVLIWVLLPAALLPLLPVAIAGTVSK